MNGMYNVVIEECNSTDRNHPLTSASSSRLSQIYAFTGLTAYWVLGPKRHKLLVSYEKNDQYCINTGLPAMPDEQSLKSVARPIVCGCMGSNSSSGGGRSRTVAAEAPLCQVRSPSRR